MGEKKKEIVAREKPSSHVDPICYVDFLVGLWSFQCSFLPVAVVFFS